jgi:hypothetical protein
MTTPDIKDETKRAREPLSRRTLMRAGAVGMTSLAAWLTVAVSKARAAKFAQKAVFYRPHPSLGQKCGNCRLFRRPHTCRLVAGPVSANGWCVIWRGR